MKKLTIFATKRDAEGNPYTAFSYEYEGAASAQIVNGFVNVYEIDTHVLHAALIKMDEYEDVTIYNY